MFAPLTNAEEKEINFTYMLVGFYKEYKEFVIIAVGTLLLYQNLKLFRFVVDLDKRPIKQLKLFYYKVSPIE